MAGLDIGGYEQRPDWPKMGPPLLIAACLVMASAQPSGRLEAAEAPSQTVSWKWRLRMRCIWLDAS
jgi:hypothetical protein